MGLRVLICACVLYNRSTKLSRLVDAYCGIVLLAVYFTYFLVVKGTLSAFDCTNNSDGIPILDAEPSYRCDEVP